MNYQIVAERQLGKTINEDTIKTQIKKMVMIAMKSGRGEGWDFPNIVIKKPVVTNEYISHVANLSFNVTLSKAVNNWPSIVQRFAKAGQAGPFASNPWMVIEPEGYNLKSKKVELKKKADEVKILGDVNLNPRGFFNGIFGREAHIRRTLDALLLAKRTNWNKRINTLYDGPVGCGKTSCMLAMAEMLGKENEAYRWFDATSMTKAGAIEEIMENPIVPPVLFIEEIEKCAEDCLRWLLGVMDSRGQIRRTNYRVGNQAKHVRMLVIASANDVDQLKKMMFGALYSRFQNRIYFPEPNRKIMQQILEREVKEIEGKMSWVKPALEFGYDKWNLRDPRDIINILSCGGDRLLTGKYQKDYEQTMHPLDKKIAV